MKKIYILICTLIISVSVIAQVVNNGTGVNSIKGVNDLMLSNTNTLINPIVKKITNDVKPKVTPRMCGIVFVIPKLKPE